MTESVAGGFGLVHAQQNASHLSVESNGHVGHGLDTASNHDVTLTRQDLSDAGRDRLIRRDACLRDRVCWYAIGETGCQRCLFV